MGGMTAMSGSCSNSGYLAVGAITFVDDPWYRNFPVDAGVTLLSLSKKCSAGAHQAVVVKSLNNWDAKAFGNVIRAS